MSTKSTVRRKIFGVVAVCALVAGGSYFSYQNYLYVWTDNAMVQAQTTLLASKVSGIISRVAVQENQKVKAGQVLVEIEASDYKNRVEHLEAEAGSLAAELRGAEINYNRTRDLHAKGAATQERLDAADVQLRSFKEKLKAAETQVALAKINLGYTKILAPADGKVGRKSFEVGMFTNAGQPLLGFVEGDQRWVVANLKETDMDKISVGKKARISVDAISSKEFDGIIESISPTTGATFSILPPDNATGNFTKVIQRIPVRIQLLNLSSEDIDRLQSGLSAEVNIRVR